jgi:hypothetical protein
MIEKICTKEVWRAKYEFGEILRGHIWKYIMLGGPCVKR